MVRFYAMAMKLFLLIVLGSGLAACSMEANISTLPNLLTEGPFPDMKAQRTEVDFVAGEMVTTDNGVVVSGSFGEISEKKVLSSGVVIEGVFYE